MQQKIPFVLASTAHGSIILPRNDWRKLSDTHNEFGVGADILVHGEYDLPLISMTVGVLAHQRDKHGAGVVALDCGANIGIYSIEWARAMEGWGSVIAFEPQERIYYALCGNLALNNLFNVKAHNAAIAAKVERIDMPVLDYQLPAQFGGLKLKGENTIGQEITARTPIVGVPIDSLMLKRCDFIKLDIEGMEAEALEGARSTIIDHQPFLLVEWVHAGKPAIEAILHEIGYELAYIGMNAMAGPKGNEITPRIAALEAGRAKGPA